MSRLRTVIALPMAGALAACCFASTSARAQPPAERNVCQAASWSPTREMVLAGTRLMPPRAVFAPPRSLAAPRAHAESVEIEVRDGTSKKTTKVERFTVPLTDGEVSELESRVGDASYRIKLLQVHDRPLSFEIKRHSSDSAVTEADVRTAVRLRRGQRAVIARIERADGRRTEVIATLH
jgi:hypothetical protein